MLSLSAQIRAQFDPAQHQCKDFNWYSDNVAMSQGNCFIFLTLITFEEVHVTVVHGFVYNHYMQSLGLNHSLMKCSTRVRCLRS